MVVLGRLYTIPTNTPAFQDYAFHTLFTNAQVAAAKWNLDRTLIVTNKVTTFWAKPHLHNLTASVMFNERYVFGTDGGCIGFTDRPYYYDEMQSSNGVKKWLHATNLLTMKKAQALAESAIREIGIRLDKVEFKRPKERKQWTCWHEGKDRLMPYYEFTWDSNKASCNVHVSGLTSNIVHFSFLGPYLRFERPTNYFEMLGLPTNTVFVKRIFIPGLHPVYEIIQP